MIPENYDHWKTTNPDDRYLGPEPDDDLDWSLLNDDDELPADWPPMDDDPQSMTGGEDE